MPASPRRPVDRAAAAAAIEAFLRAIGLDPDGDAALSGTGARVADAFADDLCAGYDVDVDALVSDNALPGEGAIVIVRGIDVTTTCPHHLMPAIGRADVAFAPNGKLIGVGAVARVVHAFSQRLTLQETIGDAVVGALDRVLAPHWVACRLDLAHACMIARGERQHGARVETLSLRGAIAAGEAAALFGAGAHSR
jgi:GTP cyclohydrolase I